MAQRQDDQGRELSSQEQIHVEIDPLEMGNSNGDRRFCESGGVEVGPSGRLGHE